jgi:hypothetical protein
MCQPVTLTEILLRAWRDRETGCSALEMFISQRPWNEIIPHLPALWVAGSILINNLFFF